jgi:hypothetical protein
MVHKLTLELDSGNALRFLIFRCLDSAAFTHFLSALPCVFFYSQPTYLLLFAGLEPSDNFLFALSAAIYFADSGIPLQFEAGMI